MEADQRVEILIERMADVQPATGEIAAVDQTQDSQPTRQDWSGTGEDSDLDEDFMELVFSGAPEMIVEKLGDAPGLWGMPTFRHFAPVLSCAKCSTPTKGTLYWAGKIDLRNMRSGQTTQSPLHSMQILHI